MFRDMKSFLECRFDKCKRELPWFMRPYRPLLKRPEELGLVKSNFMHTYLKHLTKLIDRGRVKHTYVNWCIMTFIDTGAFVPT